MLFISVVIDKLVRSSLEIIFTLAKHFQLVKHSSLFETFKNYGRKNMKTLFLVINVVYYCCHW
jgi:hypothetical protein